LLSDGPYQELVYDIELPFIPDYYDNTIIIYSFSKISLLKQVNVSVIFLFHQRQKMLIRCFASICGAGRSLGYVCAPSLFQFLIKECIGLTADLSVYKKNRDLLYNGLINLGFEAIYPDGAFYLFC